MVKKVIDIFPPRKNDSEDKEENYLQENAPSIALNIEEPVKPKITYIAPQLGSIKEKKAQKGANLPSFAGFLIKLGIIAGLFFGAIYLIDLKYAHAVIAIIPQPEKVTASGQVLADTKLTDPDVARQAIPAVNVPLEKEFSVDFQATGKKSQETKAKGAVKIFNNYTVVQRLVAGTRLQAPLDKFQPALSKDQAPWFRTAESVIIQPKSTATVNVTADGAGEQYNIDPSVFSVPGLAGTPQYTFIYAQSSEKFSGGTSGDAAQATQIDIDNSKSALTSSVQSQIKNELLQKLLPGYVLIPETINMAVGDITSSAAAGDLAQTFTSRAKVTASAIAVRQIDLDSFAKELIIKSIPSQMRLGGQNASVEANYIKTDQTTGQVTLSLNASAMAYPEFEAQKLKETLSGKGVNEVKIILANEPKIRSAQIKLTPFWKQNLPKDIGRIDVSVQIE